MEVLSIPNLDMSKVLVFFLKEKGVRDRLDIHSCDPRSILKMKTKAKPEDIVCIVRALPGKDKSEIVWFVKIGNKDIGYEYIFSVPKLEVLSSRQLLPPQFEVILGVKKFVEPFSDGLLEELKRKMKHAAEVFLEDKSCPAQIFLYYNDVLLNTVVFGSNPLVDRGLHETAWIAQLHTADTAFIISSGKGRNNDGKNVDVIISVLHNYFSNLKSEIWVAEIDAEKKGIKEIEKESLNEYFRQRLIAKHKAEEEEAKAKKTQLPASSVN